MKNTKKFSILCAVLASAMLAAQTTKTAPTVRADIEVATVTTLSDGNQLQKSATEQFYRDSQGRTRLENGNMITINDPVAHQVLVVDMVNRTVQKIVSPPAPVTAGPTAEALARSPEMIAKPAQNQAQQPQPGTNLGVKNIDGFDAEGKETVSTIPANSNLGNKLPIQRTTRIWKSPTLNLPILVEIDDPVHGHITMKYKNLQAGVLLDPILFEAPAGFTVIDRKAVSRPAASGQFPKPTAAATH